MVTATGYARHSRHFWAEELRAYVRRRDVLASRRPDAGDPSYWLLRANMSPDTVAALLAAAGAQRSGEATREGGFVARTGDPDDEDYLEGNTARMTVADVGH